MPIVTHWYLEHRVALAHVMGDITREDLSDHATQMMCLLNTGRPPIHALFDCTYLRRPIFDLREADRLHKYMTHPYLGWSVAFGGFKVPAALVAVKALSTAFRIKARNLHRAEDALRFLREADSTLDFTNLPIPILRPEDMNG